MGNTSPFLDPALIIKLGADLDQKGVFQEAEAHEAPEKKSEASGRVFWWKRDGSPSYFTNVNELCNSYIGSPSFAVNTVQMFSFLSLAPSLSSFFLFLQLCLPSFPFIRQTWLHVGVFYGSFFFFSPKMSSSIWETRWIFSSLAIWNAYFLHGISLITHNLQTHTHVVHECMRVSVVAYERLPSLLFYRYLSLCESASFLIIVSHRPISLPRAFLRGRFLKLCALVMYLR